MSSEGGPKPAPSTRIVVGLGNPGREYAGTRHNVGWLLLDELLARASGVAAPRKKFLGELSRGTLADQDCIFLRPGTFMNESGRSVQPAAAFFRAPPWNIVVLHDELDLPFGDVRIKRGGGHAGHNGLRSIVEHLGTADFARIRLGIGRPPATFTGDVAAYVLSAFSADERTRLPVMIESATNAVLSILRDGLDRAMNAVNTRPKAAPTKN